MDIWNEEPRQVKCIRNDDETWGHTDKASESLEVGKIYSLIDVDRHDWHTRITLAEFPDKQFNSVLFEELD